MYEKWSKYTQKNPYRSVIIVAIVASLIGITVEYLINRTFVSGGFWVTFILILGQFLIIKKRKNR